MARCHIEIFMCIQSAAGPAIIQQRSQLRARGEVGSFSTFPRYPTWLCLPIIILSTRSAHSKFMRPPTYKVSASAVLVSYTTSQAFINTSPSAAGRSISPIQTRVSINCFFVEKIWEIARIIEARMELGAGQYGCSHYRRRCKIRAPCCGEVFDCRHCHNEAKNSLDVDPCDRHEIPRHDINKLICSLCNTEQDVNQYCKNCGVCLGKYFCAKCKFFDDNISKKQYHCDGCGICRTGGQENFFHCHRCGCCCSNSLMDSHRCVERAMHCNCPVCLEYLFDSTKEISVLPCAHTIHLECLKVMRLHSQFSCPVCSRSVCDMSSVWQKLDEEVASIPMPEKYQNKMVRILCNDCGEKSNVHFHVLAHKCPTCRSYNTRQTRDAPSTCATI